MPPRPAETYPPQGLPASRALGRFIARRRQDHLRLSQKAFGAKMGWSQKTQYSLEAGLRPLMDDGEVLLLARELQLSENDIRTAAAVLPDAATRHADADLPLDSEPLAAILELVPTGQLERVRSIVD